MTAEKQTPARESASGTQSLQRAVSLLRQVAARGGRGARLTDLVADSGLSKATVRRLLSAMIREGLIEQEAATRRYYLGPESYLLGQAAAGRFGAHNLTEEALLRLNTLARHRYAGSALSLAALLCDRHADQGHGPALALIHEDASGRTARLTYGELLEHSRRFAGVLAELGVAKGERVATLLPKGPEFLIAVVALWRLGAIHVPLFTAFGAEAVAQRLTHSGARVVVTNGLCRGAIGAPGAGLSVVTVESGGPAAAARGDLLFWSALHAAAPYEGTVTLSGEDPFILLYTGGRGGEPLRGLPIPVKALAAIEQDMRLGYGLRDEDVFWNLADPGWAVGLHHGVVGPLLLGRTILFCDGPFDARQLYRVLLRYGVTNLLSPPVWYRRLQAAEATTPPPKGLRLRVASSIGDPMPEELYQWVTRNLCAPLHDQYGQAEFGIMVLNHHAPALRHPRRPGSIGQPMPGVTVVLLDADGREVGENEDGELAIDTERTPLFWFRGYFRDSALTAERFRLGRRYYLTGDLARRDGEGNIYYLGRVHDLAAGAGHPAAPREVESAVVSHAAVAEATVVSKPDKSFGEIVQAFIVLRPGHRASPELAEEIVQHVKSRLPPQAYPPAVEFVAALPPAGEGKARR